MSPRSPTPISWSASGLGLEQSWLRELLENAARDPGAIVELGQVIDPIEFAETEAEEGDEEHDGHGHGLYDPHFWFDPLRVQRVVSDIAARLAALDPGRADAYRANADAYNARLDELHAWTEEQVGALPAERRLLVTSHDSLGYFAERYGFEVVGVILSITTEVEPSAGNLIELSDAIGEYGVPAVFGETTVSERPGRRPGDGNRRRARPALLGLARHGGQRRGDVHRDGADERRARDRGPAVTGGAGRGRAARRGASMWRGALAAPLEARR